MKESRYRRMPWRDILIIVAVFVVISFLFARGILPSVTFLPGETSLTLKGPEKTQTEISYDEIVSAELVSEPDYGAAAGGGTSGRFHYGTWTNEAWGEYEAFVSEDIPCCILIRTKDGAVAFNTESQDTMERLYPQLLEYGGISSPAVD